MPSLTRSWTRAVDGTERRGKLGRQPVLGKKLGGRGGGGKERRKREWDLACEEVERVERKGRAMLFSEMERQEIRNKRK